MDWFEKLFGLSPDGGSGSSETLFVAGLFGLALLVTTAAYRRIRAANPS
jgi:hypothetical protein